MQTVGRLRNQAQLLSGAKNTTGKSSEGRAARVHPFAYQTSIRKHASMAPNSNCIQAIKKASRASEWQFYPDYFRKKYSLVENKK